MEQKKLSDVEAKRRRWCNKGYGPSREGGVTSVAQATVHISSFPAHVYAGQALPVELPPYFPLSRGRELLQLE